MPVGVDPRRSGVRRYVGRKRRARVAAMSIRPVIPILGTFLVDCAVPLSATHHAEWAPSAASGDADPSCVVFHTTQLSYPHCPGDFEARNVVLAACMREGLAEPFCQTAYARAEVWCTAKRNAMRGAVLCAADRVVNTSVGRVCYAVFATNRTMLVACQDSADAEEPTPNQETPSTPPVTELPVGTDT